MGRAVGPVVAPADDDVAAGEGVAVVAEIAALKFEFEMDALPAMRGDLALGFAVREAGLHGFDGVASSLATMPKSSTTPCSLTGSWRRPRKSMGWP